jgi:hypothetical protein
VDADRLRADAGARLGKGKALAKGRSVEHLVVAALKRGARSNRDGVDLETKIASARAHLRAGRTKG